MLWYSLKILLECFFFNVEDDETFLRKCKKVHIHSNITRLQGKKLSSRKQNSKPLKSPDQGLQPKYKESPGHKKRNLRLCLQKELNDPNKEKDLKCMQSATKTIETHGL